MSPGQGNGEGQINLSNTELQRSFEFITIQLAFSLVECKKKANFTGTYFASLAHVCLPFCCIGVPSTIKLVRNTSHLFCDVLISIILFLWFRFMKEHQNQRCTATLNVSRAPGRSLRPSVHSFVMKPNNWFEVRFAWLSTVNCSFSVVRTNIWGAS